MTVEIDGNSTDVQPQEITSDYTTNGEGEIHADTSISALTVTLASADATADRRLRVVDTGLNAGTNAITVATEGAETINPGGASSITLTVNGTWADFWSDGTNWFVDRAAEVNTAVVASQLNIPTYSSDGAAPNETLFLNTSDNKFKYKDSSGTVRDAVIPHASTHENGGSDEISVAGLSGDLADAQDPKAHASTHGSAGADTIDAGDLGGSGGTNGQFLQTDGTAAQWGGLSGTALTLIESQSPSGVSSADFTTGIDSDHRRYIFEVTDIVPATDGEILQLQVSNDGGSTWQSGASDYAYALDGLNDAGTSITVSSTGDTHVRLSSGNVGNAAGEAASATVTLSDPSGTSVDQLVGIKSGDIRSGGGLGHISGYGRYLTAEAIDGVRFQFANGNISSGTIELVGVN